MVFPSPNPDYLLPSQRRYLRRGSNTRVILPGTSHAALSKLIKSPCVRPSRPINCKRVVTPRADLPDIFQGQGSRGQGILPRTFQYPSPELELLSVAPGVDVAGFREGEDVVCSAGEGDDFVGGKGLDGGWEGGYGL
jgi:hypothetical protein